MGSFGTVNLPRSMKKTSANSFFCSGVQLAVASSSVLNAFEIAMFSDESVGIRFWALAQKLQNKRVIKRRFFIGLMLMVGKPEKAVRLHSWVLANPCRLCSRNLEIPYRPF